jgi:hypothetical protein
MAFQHCQRVPMVFPTLEAYPGFRIPSIPQGVIPVAPKTLCSQRSTAYPTYCPQSCRLPSPTLPQAYCPLVCQQISSAISLGYYPPICQTTYQVPCQGYYSPYCQLQYWVRDPKGYCPLVCPAAY